jgi:hypothetical protein
VFAFGDCGCNHVREEALAYGSTHTLGFAGRNEGNGMVNYVS